MSFSEHMICFMYVFHYSKMLSEENDSILLGPIIYPCSENWHNKSPNVNKIEGGSPTPTNIYCTNGKTNIRNGSENGNHLLCIDCLNEVK